MTSTPLPPESPAFAAFPVFITCGQETTELTAAYMNSGHWNSSCQHKVLCEEKQDTLIEALNSDNNSVLFFLCDANDASLSLMERALEKWPREEHPRILILESKNTTQASEEHIGNINAIVQECYQKSPVGNLTSQNYGFFSVVNDPLSFESIVKMCLHHFTSMLACADLADYCTVISHSTKFISTGMQNLNIKELPYHVYNSFESAMSPYQNPHSSNKKNYICKSAVLIITADPSDDFFTALQLAGTMMATTCDTMLIDINLNLPLGFQIYIALEEAR